MPGKQQRRCTRVIIQSSDAYIFNSPIYIYTCTICAMYVICQVSSQGSSGKHIDYREDKALVGTARYALVKAHSHDDFMGVVFDK